MNFDSLMSSLRSTVDQVRPLAQDAAAAVRSVAEARTAVQLGQINNQRTVMEAQMAYQAAAAQMSPAFSPWQTNAQRFNASASPPAGGIPAWLLVVAAAGLVWMVAR